MDYRISWTWRRTAVVVLLLTLAALSPVGWKASRYWYWRHSAAKLVKAEIARLKAAGEPLTATELHAAHDLPDGSRALTEKWLHVLAQLDSVRPDSKSNEYRSLPLVGMKRIEDLESHSLDGCLLETEKYLRRIAPQIEALLAVSLEDDEVRFPVPFERHIGALVPHAQQLRFAAQILFLQARVHAIQGNTDDLERTLSASATLPKALDNSWMMIEQLVRCAITRIACEAILDAANRGQLSPDAMLRLAKQLGELDFKRAANRAYMGERVTFWEAMDANAALLSGGEADAVSWVRKAGPIDRAFLLEAMAKAVRASQHDFRSAADEFNLLDQELKEMMMLSGLERFHYLYSVLLLPQTYAAYPAFFNQEARVRVTQASLFAHAFRLHAGRWPHSLAELIDSNSSCPIIDPFSGEHLRFHADGPTILIYSVGRDLSDDGGNELNAGFEPDIVAVVKLR